MESLQANAAMSVIALSGGFLLYKSLADRRDDHLPPGPRPLPLVGNALQMPLIRPWLAFSEWSKTYGDLLYVNVFGRPIVVITSSKIASELLDGRSSIYSDRPHFIMAGDLVGYDETLALQPYGDNWREQRKLISKDFSKPMIPRYYPLQEKEGRILVRNILKDPTSLESQIKLRIGIIIIRVTYGYYIQTTDDPFLTTPLQAMANFSEATAPGNFLVDFIPSLKHLPLWMPGSGFLIKAKEWKKVVWDASWNPYLWSKANLQTGATLMPSLCGTILNDKDGEISADQESKLVWAASAVMGGGLDTNMSTALTFFLAMVLHPDVQAKAQAEIDSIVGFNRLPCIKDKYSLPYVRSLVTEVMRWNPAVPMGIPHALSEDDVYNGIHLPKHAILMPNVWHMLHDPETYENPMEFQPERYKNLDSEMKKVTDLAFGFGRRTCPGAHFAEGTIFAIVLTTLATCDILPEIDSRGTPQLPSVAYTTGTISFPESFSIRLKSRSARAADMLNKASSVPE